MAELRPLTRDDFEVKSPPGYSTWEVFRTGRPFSRWHIMTFKTEEQAREFVRSAIEIGAVVSKAVDDGFRPRY